MSRSGGPDFDTTHAPCRTVDRELFFGLDGQRGPGRAAREEAAKAVCARCPVVDDCLDWALDTGDDWAVLGGTTADERRHMRRRNREQVAA